jgi:hypothetical protein
MFDSPLLSRKPQVFDEQGEVVSVDLGARTLKSIDVTVQTITKVGAGEEARPDLVALRLYGDDQYESAICKMSGISNPYSVNLDDLIIAPNYLSFSRELQNQAPETAPTENSDFRLNFKEIPLINEPTVIQRFNDSFDKSLDQLKEDGSNLPPNVADFGDKQFLIKGGQVIFAPNIGKCITNEEQPISKGELLARLIKNRII